MPDIKLVGRPSYISPRTYGKKVKQGQTIRVRQEDATALLAVTYGGSAIFTTSGLGVPAYDFSNRSQADGVVAGIGMDGNKKRLIVPGHNTPVPTGALAPEDYSNPDPGQQVTNVTYDPSYPDRVTSETVNGVVRTYGYNSTTGRLSTITANGVTKTVQYDTLGRYIGVQ